MITLMTQTDIMVLSGTLLLVLFIALIFYIKFDIVRLGGLAKGLKQISNADKKLPFDQKGKMDTLLDMASKTGNPVLETLWREYHREYADRLKGEICPDISYYFNENNMINIPCGRQMMERAGLTLFILGIAGSLLYPSLYFLGFDGTVTPEGIIRSLGILLLELAVVSVIVFLFKVADAARLERTRKGLWEYQYKLSGWLNPISEPTEISLLVESQRQNTLAFQEAVQRLENRLDTFETETMAPMLGDKFREAIEQNITPVLKQTSGVLSDLSDALITRQENGMKELAQTFTEKVTAVTADRLNTFAEKTTEITGVLETVVSGMSRIQEATEQNAKSQEKLCVQSLDALNEAGKVQTQVSEALRASLDSVRAAEAVAAEMKAYAVQGMDKADAMALQSLQLLEENVAQVKSVQNGIAELTGTLQGHMDQSITRISETLTGAVEKYAEIFAEIEASRKLHGEQTDQRIGQMVEGLDLRLSDFSSRILNSSALAMDKLTSSVTEISESSSLLLEQINEKASQMVAEITGKLDNSNMQISGYLARAVAEYAEVSNRMEASRERYSEELDNRLGQLIKATDERLAGYTENIMGSHTLTAQKLTAVAEGFSLSSSNLLEQINERASRLFSDVATKLESSSLQISGDIVRAVEGYTEVSTKMEESREKYGYELDERLSRLMATTDERLSDYSNRIMASNLQTTEKLADMATEVSLEGKNMLEKAGRQASDLYGDLLSRMDKSIDSMGENLAVSMRAAMGESMEIVEKLAVRTAEMKDLYDDYFTRIAEQSSKTLDELDFSIQKTMASFSSETAEIISKITNNSSGALEFFDKGIKELVENMDENSRSIGLYAKEINIDVADLSANLRLSVKEFNERIQGGINGTFADFDKGLGEVTLRLATILESIRDSAEALQSALKTGTKQ
ncbi:MULTISPECIES: hypothetical protein [unclassified Dehalobacter]|uniref:hypothetical protein n=1 Tax=unclassified Dehalobacter TaxID=2635733 RepID=UPI000367972C|nr:MULTISPECIES: hypothetical protein [unclassified Dehalobacter]RJE49106.1 hypothetical protein A7K50_13495 [Dehalobacter sp. MCB1]TCX47200.1 hypothetical protein C1I36_14510 [Dehalobacter sp. 14DCB1]TCX55340.1 hypothetical protein C1I38_03255 [Dehalobacter sp. 12DCB1]